MRAFRLASFDFRVAKQHIDIQKAGNYTPFGARHSPWCLRTPRDYHRAAAEQSALARLCKHRLASFDFRVAKQHIECEQSEHISIARFASKYRILRSKIYRRTVDAVYRHTLCTARTSLRAAHPLSLYNVYILFKITCAN